MSERRKRIVSWTLCLVWSGFALTAAITFYVVSGAKAPLDYLASLVVAGGLTGWSAGRLLEGAARRIGRLVIGGLSGHIAFVPPAIQLGQWVAGLAVQTAAVYYASGGLVVYIIAFAAVATAVLSAGSMLGMALEAALRIALRRLSPNFASRGVQRLRPSWKALRITVLVVMLLGVLVYADNRVGVPWPEATPPRLSKWIEREKSLFREALAAHRYDVVVLPVQTEEPGFDRIARSLMTRYLTQGVEERIGAPLPDPTLLARALDARARRLDLEDALRVAASLGARTVVAGKVRRVGQAFNFRVEVWTRDDKKGAWREHTSGALEGLRFHDRLPPSVAFRDAMDSLLDPLKLGEAKPAAVTAHAPAVAAQPIDDLLRLATLETGSAAERALHLQVLASLHERKSLEAETLWERSLVALRGVKDPSELARVLEARAYMHLSRRPYALERLGQPATPAGRALLAALNGHVPDLEAAAKSIEHRGLRLMAEIELADLYDAYSLHKRLVARRKALLDAGWTDALALGFRLSAPDWFRGDVHGPVAAALTRVVSVELDWHETAGAWLRWLYWLPDPLGSQDLRLARSIERRYATVWTAKAADWPVRRAADRLAEWDYYDLLFALNREAILKTLYSTLHKQGLPEHAATMIESLGSLFAGHPRLVYFQARALDKIGEKAARGAQQRRHSRSSALAVSAYRWEGGESHLSTAAEYYIYERQFEKYLDEPPRWYRAEFPRARLHFDRIAYSAQEIAREIAEAERRLEFSDRDVRPLRRLVRWLRRAGRMEDALAAVETNRHRFVGTLGRAELLAEARETARRGVDPLPVYRELLELDPDSWAARRRLAQAYMEGGRSVQAQQTLLAYPGFANHEGHNIVGLSNNAFDAGYYFYRRGEPQLGLQLLAQSTRLRTGSSREFHSRELLAVMQNDLNGALEHARYQVDRYNDSRAGMRQVLYLFMLGRNDQAWSRFTAFANRFGNENVWTAAFVAHRMQGLEGRELEKWLAQAAANDTRRDYLTNALRERHAFMLALTDRTPSDEALALIRRVARANNDSPFYPQLAEGYLALRKGDYAGAAQKLRGPHNDLFNLSVNRRQSLSEWLPYLVLAYARSGRDTEVETLMADHLNNIGIDSDYLVARALLEGRSGRHESAVAALRLAFYRLASPRTRAFVPGYLLLEACEMLLTESGNDVYRQLIEDFARRLQVEVPYAWAAAFEAKYARDLDTRQLALAAAAILDPQSQRIRHFSEKERNALRGAALRHGSVLGAALRQAARGIVGNGG